MNRRLPSEWKESGRIQERIDSENPTTPPQRPTVDTDSLKLDTNINWYLMRFLAPLCRIVKMMGSIDSCESNPLRGGWRCCRGAGLGCHVPVATHCDRRYKATRNQLRRLLSVWPSKTSLFSTALNRWRAHCGAHGRPAPTPVSNFQLGRNWIDRVGPLSASLASVLPRSPMIFNWIQWNSIEFNWIPLKMRLDLKSRGN